MDRENRSTHETISFKKHDRLAAVVGDEPPKSPKQRHTQPDLRNAEALRHCRQRTRLPLFDLQTAGDLGTVAATLRFSSLRPLSSDPPSGKAASQALFERFVTDRIIGFVAVRSFLQGLALSGQGRGVQTNEGPPCGGPSEKNLSHWRSTPRLAHHFLRGAVSPWPAESGRSWYGHNPWPPRSPL